MFRFLAKTIISGLITTVVCSTTVKACTFLWDPVTHYTDGTAIVETVNYKLYLKGVGSPNVQAVADVSTVSTSLVCVAGDYYVTAYTATALESDKSNTVTLKQTGKSTNLKWAN